MENTRKTELREIVALMKGEKEYSVHISQYTSEVLPTNINMLLVNCFYKPNERDNRMRNVFVEAMEVLLNGTAADVYIAVLYFDACLYYEERAKATFTIDRKKLASKIQNAVNTHTTELKDRVIFCNGMVKKNPWEMIEKYNEFYIERYNFAIV